MAKILDDLTYDESKIDAGIDKVLSGEKNAANRYNPFCLNQKTTELSESIKRDHNIQTQKNI